MIGGAEEDFEVVIECGLVGMGEYSPLCFVEDSPAVLPGTAGSHSETIVGKAALVPVLEEVAVFVVDVAVFGAIEVFGRVEQAMRDPVVEVPTKVRKNFSSGQYVNSPFS